MSRKSSLHHRIRRSAFNATVPHAQNDYRPHLIRWPSIMTLAIGVILLQVVYNVLETGSVLGRVTSIDSTALLRATNAERTSDGESELRMSTKLTAAANQKVEDMFSQQYWAHTSPAGSTPWTWFDKVEYHYQDAGENLAKDFSTSNGVVAAWMNSPAHRENLLDSRYKEVGFASKSGVLNGEETTVVVALYGAPKGDVGVVAGTSRQAASSTQSSLIDRIGVGIQSLTPAAIGSIILLLIATVIALIAHSYRRRLPYEWRQSWRQHHGAYTALSLVSMITVLITLYGGGQV